MTSRDGEVLIYCKIEKVIIILQKGNCSVPAEAYMVHGQLILLLQMYPFDELPLITLL